MVLTTTDPSEKSVLFFLLAPLLDTERKSSALSSVCVSWRAVEIWYSPSQQDYPPEVALLAKPQKKNLILALPAPHKSSASYPLLSGWPQPQKMLMTGKQVRLSAHAIRSLCQSCTPTELQRSAAI